jgi:hypothetical protein
MTATAANANEFGSLSLCCAAGVKMKRMRTKNYR